MPDLEDAINTIFKLDKKCEKLEAELTSLKKFLTESLETLDKREGKLIDKWWDIEEENKRMRSLLADIRMYDLTQHLETGNFALKETLRERIKEII